MNLGGTGRNVLWFVVALVVVGAVWFAWMRPHGPDYSLTIRSYDVKPEIAEEMRSALNSAMTAGGGPLSGRVTLSPNGQLLVTAPANVQEGVQKLLADVSSRKPAATPSILFEAWLVTAAPGSSAEPGSQANLLEVEPALAAIRKSRGNLRFELVEKLVTRVRSSSERSVIKGARATMVVTPTIRLGEKDMPVVTAAFGIEVHRQRGDTQSEGRSLQTIAELRPGQLLVVGQSGVEGKPGDTSAAPDGEIYYIVRASL